MTPRARRVAALVAVLATLAALRLLVPDPAMRREWMLLVMIPLGYGHVLGALCFGRQRARRLREFGGFAVAVLTLLLLEAGAVPTIVALAAFAVWHVLENEAAATGRGRLPPLPRSPRRHLGPLLASAGVIAAALATPWLTHPALRVGVPAGFAAWTAEEVFAAVLYYHVVVWALHTSHRGRMAAVFAVHALPLALASGSALVWPAAHAFATAPLPYLVVSVTHALHTAWERGLAPRA